MFTEVYIYPSVKFTLEMNENYSLLWKFIAILIFFLSLIPFLGKFLKQKNVFHFFFRLSQFFWFLLWFITIIIYFSSIHIIIIVFSFRLFTRFLIFGSTLWIDVQQETYNMLLKWGLMTNPSCMLCVTKHFFFQCNYSWNVTMVIASRPGLMLYNA